MVNYNLGKIYTLRTYNDESLIYVGSTCQQLSKRLYHHKYIHKRYTNDKKHYVSSYKVIDCGEPYIELLENFSCNTKEELHAREGYWIRKLDCVNMCIAGRTHKQYSNDNKDIISDKKKLYYKTNRDKFKDYHLINKKKNNERSKAYNERNKERIKIKASVRYTCTCGSILRKADMRRHERTKKHRELFIKVIEQRIQEMEAEMRTIK